MRAFGFGEVWVPPLQTGGRARRQMNRQGSLGAIHRLGDMGKELPEDEELSDFLDADIPGLANNPERSFDFVTEVRTQLAHLPPDQVDEFSHYSVVLRVPYSRQEQCHGCHLHVNWTCISLRRPTLGP